MRSFIPVAAIVSIVAAAAPARAQNDFVGTRAMGMGEAQRANATGASGPLLNPAGMSLVRQYVIEGMYGIKIEDVGHNANLSVVDSITSRVAAGLFYDYIYETPQIGFNWAGGRIDSEQISRTGHAAGLSLSLPLGDHFIIGATAKYLHLDTTAPLPMGTVPDHLTLDSVNGVTFDVGMIVKLGDTLQRRRSSATTCGITAAASRRSRSASGSRTCRSRR